MSQMMELAEHIVTLANEKSRSITLWELRQYMMKLMTIAYRNKVYDKKTLSDIYDEAFICEKYGPAIRSVYKRYYLLDEKPIEITTEKRYDKYEQLNEYIIRLFTIDAQSLYYRYKRNKWVKQAISKREMIPLEKLI